MKKVLIAPTSDVAGVHVSTCTRTLIFYIENIIYLGDAVGVQEGGGGPRIREGRWTASVCMRGKICILRVDEY